MLPILSEPPSSASSKSTPKRSWNATSSLERMLLGRTRPDAFPSTLLRLPALPTLTFPTFDETVSPAPATSTSRTGLFSALISDPRELLHAYLERPEAYAHELLPILLDVISGKKTPETMSPEEAQLLDQATLTYGERKKPSPDSNDKGTTSTLSSLSDGDDGDEDEEIPWRDGGGGEISLDNFELPLVPETVEGWWRQP